MTTTTTILVACSALVVATGVLLLLRSVRKLRRAQEDLAQSQERLALTLRASGIAVWSWDIPGNFINWDDSCSALFGLPPGRAPHSVQEFRELLHPDDREQVQQEISACIEQGTDYNIEFRVIWPDGAIRSLSSRARLYSEDGRPRRLTGVSWDMTERHQAEKDLREANEQLRRSLHLLERHREQNATLSEMADLLQACSTVGEAYNIVAEICARLFPAQAGALYIYSSSRNLVNKVAAWNDLRISDASFGPDDCWALRRGRPHIIDSEHSVAPCGHINQIEGAHACFPLMAQGAGIGILYLQSRQRGDPKAPAEGFSSEDRQLAVTVAERVALSFANLRLQESLRLQSIRDPLTGLFNRRYLEETLERELHRMTRREQPAGFIMMDIDHFHTFNDTFGHEGGNALLRAFGEFLLENLRKEDIACRYGGEEFCILFCEAPLDATTRLAEKLRSQVKQLQVEHDGRRLGRITISIGVASYPIHGNTITELIGAADRALYQAKTEGRDRVVTAPWEATD